MGNGSDGLRPNNGSWENQASNASGYSETPKCDPVMCELLEAFRFWSKRVFIPIIVIIGVIGSVITIVVLTRRRMRSSTNHYLTALALFDMMYLIVAFTLALDTYPSMLTYTYLSYHCYTRLIVDTCSNTSVWLTVTFTVERYIAICHPLKGKVFCTRSRAKKLVFIVAISCFVVTLPTAFETTVVERVDIQSGQMKYKFAKTDLGKDEVYQLVFYWFTSVTFVFLPLMLLTIFNAYLIRSVYQSKLNRRRMTMRGDHHDNTRQEQRITVMLIAVVIMFMVCQTPSAVLTVHDALYSYPEGSNEDAIVRAIGNICNLLVALNAACNFLFYCAFSDKYRRTFLRTFVPCMFHRGSPNQSLTNFDNSLCTQYEMESCANLNGSVRRGRPSIRSSVRRKSPNCDVNGRTNTNGTPKFNRLAERDRSFRKNSDEHGKKSTDLVAGEHNGEGNCPLIQGSE